MANEFRALVTAPDGPWGDAVRGCLTHHGVTCEPRSIVTFREIVDRGLLERPDLIVFVQPDDLADTATLLQELSLVSRSPVMTIGPADDPQRILAVLQAGAAEYIDRESWMTGLEGALIRFRTRATQINQSAKGSLLGVVSASGGTGTSTVAVNIAASLAQRHQRALLIDLDLEKGDLTAMLDLHPQFTLTDLCENASRLDRSLFEQILTPHLSGLQLLAAPYNSRVATTLHLRGVRRALAFAREVAPYTVVDLRCAETPLQQESLTQMDNLSLVLRLDYPSVRNARRFLDRLPEWGVNIDRVRLVANRYGQWRQLSVAQAEAALGRPIGILLPDDPATMNRAINNGQPAVLGAPRARIARKLTDLSISLNGKVPHAPDADRGFT